MKQRLILNLGQFRDTAPLIATQIIVAPVQTKRYYGGKSKQWVN